MFYIFKENKLLYIKESVWSVNSFNAYYPKFIPTGSYVYVSYKKRWYVKRTQAYIHPVPKDQEPKELKMQLLLLGIPF